jgi:hypothetical protein
VARLGEVEARYEFRVWGENLSGLRNRLERLAAPVRTASKETYLISQATDRCNAKIRAGLLDIKILIDERWGLEQWKPVVKAAFPLDRSVIIAQIFPRLEIRPPEFSKARYAMEEFLSEVIEVQNGIAIVELSKIRLRFNLDGCESEFTEVAFNDVAHNTAAIESADPKKLLRLASDIGFDAMENVNCVRYIKRKLGLKSPISAR